MPKNGDTIRIDGKNHSMPRIFVSLLDNLEGLANVEEVVMGPWMQRGYCENMEIKIKHYNDTTRTFKVTARHEAYLQNIFIRIKPDSKEEVEGYIKSLY
ncbi:MAG: hypothetical protein WC781_00350 [Candidatus Pacearchaeota archaeon]|jgi:hypothetical protein